MEYSCNDIESKVNIFQGKDITTLTTLEGRYKKLGEAIAKLKYYEKHPAPPYDFARMCREVDIIVEEGRKAGIASGRICLKCEAIRKDALSRAIGKLCPECERGAKDGRPD